MSSSWFSSASGGTTTVVSDQLSTLLETVGENTLGTTNAVNVLGGYTLPYVVSTANSSGVIATLNQGTAWTGTSESCGEFTGALVTITSATTTSVGILTFTASVTYSSTYSRTYVYRSKISNMNTVCFYCPFSRENSFFISFAGQTSVNGANNFSSLSIRTVKTTRLPVQGVDYDFYIGQNTDDMTLAAILSGDLNARLFAQSNTDSSPYDAFTDYPMPSGNAKIRIVSTNANDTSAGTGARTILVSGVDSDFNEVSIVMTMNGTTAVTSSGTVMVFVNSVEVLTSGSSAAPQGRIEVYIETAANNDTFAIALMMEVRNGILFYSRLMYCVPKGAIVDLTNLSLQGTTDGSAHLFKLPRANRRAAQGIVVSLSTRNRELVNMSNPIMFKSGDIIAVVVESVTSESFFANMRIRQRTLCNYTDIDTSIFNA